MPIRPIIIPTPPPGADINKNLAEASAWWHRFNPAINHLWLIWRVAPGQSWDYKHKIEGKDYQDFGNFNYGAVGTAAGFSEYELLAAAGALQVVQNAWRKATGHPEKVTESHGIPFIQYPYGDDMRDASNSKNGIASQK